MIFRSPGGGSDRDLLLRDKSESVRRAVVERIERAHRRRAGLVGARLTPVVTLQRHVEPEPPPIDDGHE